MRKSKKFLSASLAGLIALGAAGTASATILGIENFEYDVGSNNLAGQDGGTGNWTAAWGNPSNWSSTSGSIAEGSLSYSGHFSSSGNRASLDASGGTQATPRPIPSGFDTTSGTLYFSYLIHKTIDSPRSLNVSFAAGNSERFAFGQLSSDTAADHTQGNFGIFAHNNMTGEGTFVIHADDPVAFELDQTHLIVGSIEFGFDGDNDRVTFYVDPTPGASEASLVPYIQFSEYDLGPLENFRMFAGGAGHGHPGSGADYDQFRFGTSFDAVAVPEPSTYAAIFGGLALVFVVLRRRFRK